MLLRGDGGNHCAGRAVGARAAIRPWIFLYIGCGKASWPDHRRVFHPLHLPFARVSESGKEQLQGPTIFRLNG